MGQRTGEVTTLSPEQEQAFQRWAQASNISDVDHPDSHYDYRGLFLERQGQPVPVTPDRHFPDTYKQHGHITFSRESKYSRGPGDGGIWQGNQFLPPGSDLKSDLMGLLIDRLLANRR